MQPLFDFFIIDVLKMRVMRIAQIAPIIERIPPKRYGGTERVVHALAEELVKRGHEVTLFASGDSHTSAKLRSVYPRALREARMRDLYGLNNLTLLNLGSAYDSQKDFDIIHDHLAPLTLPVANLSDTPVLMTMHGAFTPENRRLFQAFRKPYVATISNAQIHGARDMNHAGVVYNGLSMEEYPFGEKSGDYLLFVGRISLEKGVHHAIDVALALDLPLIIAAKLDPVERPYYHEYVEPWLSDRIRWIGEIDEEERNKLMREALCFLHPVTWREPFGLVLIEAMATGTPVVGFNKGSIPEVVVDGKTGFVVNDLEEMIDAVANIGAIDRTACREHALKNFSAKQMADGYEDIYRKILSGEFDKKE